MLTYKLCLRWKMSYGIWSNPRLAQFQVTLLPGLQETSLKLTLSEKNKFEFSCRRTRTHTMVLNIYRLSQRASFWLHKLYTDISWRNLYVVISWKFLHNFVRHFCTIQKLDIGKSIDTLNKKTMSKLLYIYRCYALSRFCLMVIGIAVLFSHTSVTDLFLL